MPSRCSASRLYVRVLDCMLSRLWGTSIRLFYWTQNYLKELLYALAREGRLDAMPRALG
jgi:hypothetical protein